MQKIIFYYLKIFKIPKVPALYYSFRLKIQDASEGGF